MSQAKSVTPLMRQYFDIKAQYPDTILLFQVGDFYELFFDDATKAAAILGIALTSRGKHEGEPIALCGVPLHVVDLYVSKLVRAGFKVALCDQLEAATPGKVVERGVTQVLTPATLTDMKLLDEKSASYLCIFFPTQTSWALLFVELLTGQLFVTLFSTLSVVALDAELNRFMPDEIVVPATKLGMNFGTQFQQQGYAVSQEQYSAQHDAEAQDWFKKQFPQADSGPRTDGVTNGFSGALTILYRYLKRNNEQGLAEIKHLSLYKPEDYLMLDAGTQRNLELVKNAQNGTVAHTLFSVLDKAVTPMGSRMIKKWLLRPFIKKASIEERLHAVELLVRNHGMKNELRAQLQGIGDLERIVGRIALKRAQVHDYRALVKALAVVPGIKKLLASNESRLLASLSAKMGDFTALEDLLQESLSDDTSTDWLVKQGFDSRLDRLRTLVSQGAQQIIALETQERQKTGINSLKIRYNQVHGYGIEITNTHAHLVPEQYIRVQTLANRERFTMQELKNLEHDLTKARSEIVQVEKEVFERIKGQVETYIPALKKLASALAYLDGLGSLAQVAYAQRYVRPTFNDDHILSVTEGRHPVVEMRLNTGFIPNDVHLADDASLWLVTGPNMGGKSTFLRQVALITLMAQMGSFVPATSANLALVDRIFTRIGAADNVAEGKSTFLVEMEETALICTQATKQSLIILDEVGRGTSTFDGLALAQAVVEYIYTQLKARCLFATHYHELTVLSEQHAGIRPYYAASMKAQQGILLLHKIMPGIADGSFGLEVATLAQLPEPIIVRARQILKQLDHAPVLSKRSFEQVDSDTSMSSSGRGQEVMDELAKIDSEQITAKQALDVIWRLKELITKE